jgi:hypothetical protein
MTAGAMTTVAPPPPPPPTPPPPAPTPPPTPMLSVPNPPVALAQLAVGARIEGMVLPPAPSGQIQIQTSVGTLAVQTGFPLPPGGNLVLQIQSVTPQVQLRIALVDGKPPTAGLAQQATAATAGRIPTAPTAAPATTPSPVTLTVGTTVTATVLRAVPGPAPAAMGAPGANIPAAGITASSPAMPGAPSTATTTAPGTPGTGIAGSPTPARPGTATSAARPGAQPGAQPGVTTATPASAGNTPALAAGTRLSVRIVALQPPPPGATGSGPPPPAISTAPGVGTTFTAPVTGTTAFGHPVIHSQAGVLSLATPTPLPPGSRVTMELTSEPVPPQTQHAATQGKPGQALLMAREWPAMKEVAEVLQQADPAAFQHLLNTVIPRPDTQLAAGVLFFLAALRGGDLRGWLGNESTRLLERIRPGLLARMGDEFRQMGRLAEEPVQGDWRVASVPFQNGAEIEQIRILVRHHGDEAEDAEGDGSAGTRFVIDLDLSRLGHMQLDGLTRKEGKRFDLIVRSEFRLPRTIVDGIRNIFQEACELTAIKGGVGFQSSPPGFVEIATDTRDGDHVGLFA